VHKKQVELSKMKAENIEMYKKNSNWCSNMFRSRSLRKILILLCLVVILVSLYNNFNFTKTRVSIIITNELHTNLECFKESKVKENHIEPLNNKNVDNIESEKISNTQETSTNKNSECIPHGFISKYQIKDENVSCKPHQISKEACDYVKRVYKRDESLKTCGDHVRKANVCHYKQNGVEFEYSCDIQECKKFNKEYAIVKIYDPFDQKVVEKGRYKDSDSLTKAVEKIASSSIKNGISFLFIDCSNEDEHLELYQIISQFFVLPPVELQAKVAAKEEKPKLNLNVVLIDSLGRSHFYRSLPNVIKTMNKINKESKTEILDFELFQSIHGHTTENLRSLWTGSPIPRDDLRGSKIGIDRMFKKFTDNGYTTFYHDDLCFDSCGLRHDMGGTTWDKIKARLKGVWNGISDELKSNHIHNTGLTFSSCHVLETNNVTLPFNGPPGPLCYNGQFQDSYHFDYVQNRHEFASKNNISLLSYTGLMVSHDDIGRRIQSMDYVIDKFLDKISSLENTLTLLLADHGNTYTEYTHALMEGTFEQYHPYFFMIIPDTVKKTLGTDIMNNLRQNQKKLVTMLDISEAIKYIPTEIQPTGLFSNISSKRTCDDLNLRLPNLCACEGWDIAVKNDIWQVAILDFAVGQLNNKITSSQKSILQNGGNSKTPTCQRLVPVKFNKVRERNKDNYMITTFDFSVASGKGADHPYDVFHVEIQSIIDVRESSRQMQLLSFDRISKYEPYRECSDPETDIRLCICDIKATSNFHKTNKEIVIENLLNYHQIFPVEFSKTIEENDNAKCIYLKVVSYPEENTEQSIYSTSIEVANVCGITISNVEITVCSTNMKPTTPLPMVYNIPPYSMIYIGGIIRHVYYVSSKIENINFVQKGTI